jgi:hypothetical protein
LTYEPGGHGSFARSGHMPGLPAPSPVGGMQEAADE